VINLGSILPVGTIIHSMLTTTQFAAEYGDNWVLADGRSVTGSKYAAVTSNSTIPDMRGAFLRGKGTTYNPDGDLAVGTYTGDKLYTHNHSFSSYELGTGGGTPGVGYTSAGGTLNTITVSTSGGNETAPKSITVNIFIRIN
jgi:hypothetical protein